MTAFTELVGIELPVVQAGMGGGISRHRLAAAVSEAGGLGQVCTLPPKRMRDELEAARRLTRKPIAVNLLLPFVRGGHREVAEDADVVVTFWGPPRRPAATTWVHQCGSVAEARAAVEAGADAVIAQGVEAGGHVRGTAPLLEFLAAVRAELRSGFPVLAAGGIVDAADTAAAIDAGADAAVVGTRFLLTEESGAHPEYKERLLAAEETVLTQLFGLGWARAPHRVVPNASTRRWLRRGDVGPTWIRLADAALSPVVSRLPPSLQERAASRQRGWMPFLSPSPPNDASSAGFADCAPLYAGAGVTRIDSVRPAAEIVRDLAP